MKFIARLAAVIAGIIILLIAASFILLKVLVTPERIKATVIPLAEKTLNRTVTLDDVAISLFSGIELKGLTVMNASGDSPFISCGTAELHYKLMPLLDGKIEINEIRLEAPHAEITRYKDGRFNFSDIIEAISSAKREKEKERVSLAPTGPPATSKLEPATRTGAAWAAETTARDTAGNRDASKADTRQPLDITISNISITRGHLKFHDLAAPSPVTTEVDNFTLSLKNFSLDSPCPVKAGAALNGAAIRCTGSVVLNGATADLDINIDKLNVVHFLPYFQKSVPGKLERALFSADLKIKTMPGKVICAGSATLSGIDFTPSANPGATLEDADLHLDMEINLDQEKHALGIDRGRITFNNIIANATGKVTGLDKKPNLNLKIELPSQPVRNITSSVPKAFARKAASLSPGGKLGIVARVQGSPDKGTALLKDTMMQLADLSATVSGIPVVLNGKILQQADKVHSEALTVKAGDYTLNVDMRAWNIFRKPVKLVLDIDSRIINLDDLLAGAKGEGATAADGAPSAKAANNDEGTVTQSGSGRKGTAGNGTETADAGPLDIPLDAKGSLHVAELVYHRIPLKNLRINWTLKNNRLHLIQDAELAGGTVHKVVNVDFAVKGFRYDGEFAFRHALAQSILKYVSPSAGDLVYGIMNLEGDFSGAGTAPSTIKKRLSLEGKWNLQDARFGNAAIVTAIAGFLNLGEELRNVDLDKADGNFRIEEGKVIFAGRFSSDKIRLAPEGTVSLDGDTDIRLNLRLSPKLASRLNGDRFGSLFKDKDGWTAVPVLVRGSASSPSLALDTSAVASQLKQEAVRQISDSLFGKNDKKVPETDKTGDSSPDTRQKGQKEVKPEQKLLENAINSLFGGKKQ